MHQSAIGIDVRVLPLQYLEKLHAMCPNSKEQHALVEWLSSSSSYPEETSDVLCLQTHISYVFLTDHYAYKLKKPVRFEFLDFSTSQLRKEVCQAELRLNQRLAKDVYLEVVPVYSSPDGFSWTADKAASGQDSSDKGPADWLVKMRRLDEQQTLENLIRSNACSQQQIESLAAMLSTFYAGQEAAPLSASRYFEQMEQHTKANFADLAQQVDGLDSERLARLRSRQQQYLTLHRADIVQRVEADHIVEGHGDLRPEHIYFAPDPKIIDCLEFSTELRTLDKLDELCFLAMECDMLSAPEVGQRLLELYARKSPDPPDPKLVAFYKSYRACVRGKVAALRSQQVDREQRSEEIAQAERYLQQADTYAKMLGNPGLVVVRGLMGVGKSTLAEELADRLGAHWLQTDAIRKELHGSTDDHLGYGAGRYQPQQKQAVYQEMFQRAGDALAAGQNVVLDGTFLKQQLREQAAALADRHDAAIAFFHCECPAETARSRIHARSQQHDVLSDARPELFEQQRAELEPYTGDYRQSILDTRLTAAKNIEKMVATLRTIPSLVTS